MTSSLHEDVVLEISSQILAPESGGAAGGAPARGGVYSGSVELGRRLLLAARNGDTQQVLDLMAKGAPFTTDWLGTSTLHLAAGGAHLGTCAVLLRAGVSREARTKVERTPLHVAAHSGHAAVCALLLDNGAQVDCRDMLQMTPLHWACARGHADTAALLLRHGADPHARSKFHKSPRALAAAAGRSDLLALMDDALRQREAASSVDALKQAHTDEQMKEITEAEQQRALESIERLQETVKPPQKQQTVHTEPIKIDIERPPTEHQQPASAEQNSGLAAQLLQKHGITLLPQDDTSTVLNAIQSGRTVVLSDAGKLMLKESSSATFPPNGNAGNNTSKGVILTAAPVKSPLKPGVKIFTLNNTLLAMPKENKLTKKVINPHDMQIKLLSLPADTKLVSSSKVPMKAKSRLRPAPSPWPSAGVGTGSRVAAAAVSGRPAVKIIVNKANFSKMLAGKGVLENGIQLKTNTITPELSKVVQPIAAATTALQSGATQSGDSASASLAAQLAAARRDILELTAQLDALKQRLALYEPV